MLPCFQPHVARKWSPPCSASARRSAACLLTSHPLPLSLSHVPMSLSHSLLSSLSLPRHVSCQGTPCTGFARSAPCLLTHHSRPLPLCLSPASPYPAVRAVVLYRYRFFCPSLPCPCLIPASLVYLPTPQCELSGHEDAVQAVLFDPAGQYLVSCGSDNTFRLWS